MNPGGSYINKECGRFIPAALFLLCIIIPANALAGPGDTSLTVFDISDPRNPDCPCHKYQKKADREYRRFLRVQQQEQKARDKMVAEELASVKTPVNKKMIRPLWSRPKHYPAPARKRRRLFLTIFHRKSVDSCSDW